MWISKCFFKSSKQTSKIHEKLAFEYGKCVKLVNTNIKGELNPKIKSVLF